MILLRPEKLFMKHIKEEGCFVSHSMQRKDNAAPQKMKEYYVLSW